EGAQGLFERRDADAAAAKREGSPAVPGKGMAGVERLKLFPADEGDLARAVGAALQRRIMTDDEGPIPRHLDVDLQHVGAMLASRHREGGYCVFRRQRRAAAVRNVKGGRNAYEKGMQAPSI